MRSDLNRKLYILVVAYIVYGEKKMEVVLNKSDIECLITNYYKNVDEIIFEPVEIKVTLKISGIKPIEQVIKVQAQPTPQPAKLPPMDKLEKEASEGVMASGGKRRLMSRV